MNFLSRTLKFSMFIAVLFIYSCSKEKNDAETSSISSEIEKVVTFYKEGDVKIETPAQPGIPKIETQASDAYKNKIRKVLEDSYSKQTTYLKSGSNTVGVVKVKDQSCGQYAMLEWHMDCEDSGQQSERTGTLFSDWEKNSAGNIVMRFCVVNGAYFDRSANNFAVLNLYGNGSWPYDVDRIFATLDNEDSGNINNGKLGSTIWPINTTHWVGDCCFYYDTRLSFYYYRSKSNPNPMPNLGITYGVFGQFGSFQERIYSDDQDTNNGNELAYQTYNTTNHNLNGLTYPSTVAGVINQWTNTELFLSKVVF